MENIDYARIFEEVADLLEIQGANPFRVRAYRNAARTLETLPQSVESLAAENGDRLQELPGIGKDLAGKIVEIFQTGRLSQLVDIHKQVPATLADLTRIPGLGPKRVQQLWKELGITSIAELEEAARAEQIAELEGFGETTQQKILKGIQEIKAREGRFKLSEADIYVTPLLGYLEDAEGIADLEVAGSYRRRRETVGDLDILATARKGASLMQHFVAYPEIGDVLARGETKTSIRLKSGLQVDLRLVERQSYGAAMHYFTGSKAHNIAIRGLGRERGLKINEYGVFQDDERVGGRKEKEVFAAVGLPWIPPELRENRGEIEAARGDRLPALIDPEDIRGDLQMHTTYSDGKNSVAEMVEACRERSYEYMAITDHSPALRMTGLTPEDFERQWDEIDRLQAQHDDIRLLKSGEVDILEDGTLDLPDELLERMDLVVISIHSKFNLSKEEMTRRITKAMRHPRAHILAHPTGRIINRREPYPVDVEELVRVARDEGVMLELNAQPDRLDLRDYHLQMARDAGVRIVISTDAHRIAELDNMSYGVDQARRGWLEKKDVANTLPANRFLRLLEA